MQLLCLLQDDATLLQRFASRGLLQQRLDRAEHRRARSRCRRKCLVAFAPRLCVRQALVVSFLARQHRGFDAKAGEVSLQLQAVHVISGCDQHAAGVAFQGGGEQ